MLGKIISVVCKVIIFACYVIAGWAVMEYNKYSLAGVIFGAFIPIFSTLLYWAFSGKE